MKNVSASHWRWLVSHYRSGGVVKKVLVIFGGLHSLPLVVSYHIMIILCAFIILLPFIILGRVRFGYLIGV